MGFRIVDCGIGVGGELEADFREKHVVFTEPAQDDRTALRAVKAARSAALLSERSPCNERIFDGTKDGELAGAAFNPRITNPYST